MSLDQKQVQHIARLARLKVPEAELAALGDELNNILGFMEQLNAVNTEGVAPLSSVVGQNMPLRPDVVTEGDQPDAILANAPAKAEHFFVVPKVVE